MATELENFLASEAGDNAPPPPPTPPTEAAPAAPEPKPEPKAEPAAKAAPEPAEDDAETAERLDHNGQPYVPHQALERERQRRQDWKEKASRAEGELAALRRQLEEAQRAPPPPPPQPVYRAPPPDPTTDPAGYQQYAHQVEMERQINQNLNYSEWMLRDKLGDETVSALQAEFKRMAEADQTLFQKMYSQPHPYRWMQQQVEKHRAMAEIGDNPAEYKTRIEAEARARWEQERQSAPAPVSPAAGMQPSLATARSVAGRTTPGWTGEPSLDDVVSSIQNRKRTNGTVGPRF
jgi:hypothetical protein